MGLTRLELHVGPGGDWRAAAISSSGLVFPFASLEREAQVNGWSTMAPEVQTMCAVRVVATVLPFARVPMLLFPSDRN